jgi:hypothetical protein
MHGTELGALEARTAELAPFRIHSLPVFFEDAHRTHLDADAAVVASDRVYVDFKKDGGRGTDLHVLSHCS